jgi:thiamine pyrophosphate-dependent acetolactate synthase large subunit-like protein
MCLTDFVALEALLNEGSLTITQIQEKVGLASGSMTAAVDRLEKKDFEFWTTWNFGYDCRRNRRCSMGRNVADLMWEMLEKAGVERCYGIVGDALNPVVDALHRNGHIEFVHVRHEEYGVFAAVADAYLTGKPVVVCGTAGPGVTHLFNGLMDARKEGAPIIAIAGDVETKLMDTAAIEELNPYKFFETACLYVGRVVNPEQARAVINTAILTAVVDHGPTVISMPGDVASSEADFRIQELTLPAKPLYRPADADVEKLARMIEGANTVAIFGGDGCRDARDEVITLAAKLKAPVGYSFRGKQWLEHDNPYAVGMTGLLGYGGAYKAIHESDLLLLLGTDFPFPEFLPNGDERRIFGSFSWGSMANAAPNAFGAQLAFPGRQTIALCGDGGFTMLGLGDLLTQVQRKTKVLHIIFNNESLNFVNLEQEEAGLIPFGVDFKNPNFARVAEAMGAKGIRLEQPGEVKDALAEGLSYKNGPVVLDAVVDPFALSLPSHIPFHTAKGYTLSMAKQVLSGRMDSVIKTIERNVRLA